VTDESGRPQPPPGGYPPNWGNAYPPPQPGPTGQWPPQYGQPQYGQPQYGQPQYGPPGYGPPYPPHRPPVPQHPQAVPAMVFGIIGLTGFFCYVTFLVAPVAWVLGSRAVRVIDAAPETYGGRSEAMSGKVMGIIGTAFLAIAVIVVAIIVTVALNGGFDGSPEDPGTYTSTLGRA
jgi:hypothetical protein